MKIQTTISIGKHQLKIPQKFPGKLLERKIMQYIKEFAEEEDITVEEELEKITDISIMIKQYNENNFIIYAVFWFNDDYILMKPLIKYNENYTDLEVWMEELWDAIGAKIDY